MYCIYFIDLVVVFGVWCTDGLQEACSRYPNVEAVVAYMPEAFGTHHSKMTVLLRHDDLVQYVFSLPGCGVHRD